MIAEYDVTVLVTATPHRHTTSKQVITAVTGRVDIVEIDDLEHAATLSRHDGTQVNRIFTSPGEGAFELVGPFSPRFFTDGPEGLPFLQKYRFVVSQRLRGLPPSIMRAQFHPGSKIASPEEFGRVDPWASGATPAQMGAVEKAREHVEAHLSQYVVMDGNLFRRTPEPFLVLSCNEDHQQFRLSVETDVRPAISAYGNCMPIACFGLHEAKAARNHAAGLVAGPRPKVKTDGVKISEVEPLRLYVDADAMTFRAAAERMRAGFIEVADRAGGVEAALTALPLGEIVAFRGLADALSKSWDDVDAIDAAVAACLRYEADGGRQVFSSNHQVREMLEIWNDRPIGIGLSGSAGISMRALRP
ncbi:hypothetical protein OIU34_22060 [Pararhizobium sp. BT-229]|uniref:hypothetical protein n=1 Tax=Pararhizobium sp. BT-229 TaxID=2986923 RepID=UPI0021F6E8BC|nr:hypothetical protein [Pararhizobium sp. BT-229]MCV9964578.1 hypothetical protein [Pararhizobium sp. BT-229]